MYDHWTSFSDQQCLFAMEESVPKSRTKFYSLTIVVLVDSGMSGPSSCQVLNRAAVSLLCNGASDMLYHASGFPSKTIFRSFCLYPCLQMHVRAYMGWTLDTKNVAWLLCFRCMLVSVFDSKCRHLDTWHHHDSLWYALCSVVWRFLLLSGNNTNESIEHTFGSLANFSGLDRCTLPKVCPHPLVL